MPSFSALRSPSLDDVESRLIWIFGSPRSGSTWLMALLRSVDGVLGINEPLIGAHLGYAAGASIGVEAESAEAIGSWRSWDMWHEREEYFFSESYASTWLPDLRRLILRRIAAQMKAVQAARGLRADRVAIKEPHGSQAADLIMRACPRSTLVFLLRDGRDVIDSEIDATAPGSWGVSQLPGHARAERLAFVRGRAVAWLARTNIVEAAYERQAPDRRARLRYEDLLADTEGTAAELFRSLGLAVEEKQLRALVNALQFDNVPDEHRGPGRFARSGRPGQWRETMSAEEIEAMSEILGPKLAELGYE